MKRHETREVAVARALLNGANRLHVISRMSGVPFTPLRTMLSKWKRLGWITKDFGGDELGYIGCGIVFIDLTNKGADEMLKLVRKRL